MTTPKAINTDRTTPRPWHVVIDDTGGVEIHNGTVTICRMDDENADRIVNEADAHLMVDAVNKAYAFAQMISRLTIEGEIDDNGDEYSPDGNDDEVDALYGLIRDAREITGFSREVAE